LDTLGKIKNQQNELADRDKTIEQFRDKVGKLQRQIKDYEEKEEALAEEAKALSSKSKALMDQNLQLQVFTRITRILTHTHTHTHTRTHTHTHTHASITNSLRW